MSHSTAPEVGLTDTKARQRLIEDGPNQLPESRPRGMLRLLREILTEPMFLLLVACGVVYLLLGDRGEALMLLGFVFVVIGMTFFQQRRTERSLEALRDLSSPQALVLREGRARRISAAELVCGDIVLLAEGDRVPADMQLLEAANFSVDESMLTGESVPVSKACGVEAAAAQLYSGTLVTQGTGRARVTATGPRSALGRIGMSLAAVHADSTPIQQETRRIVKRVALIGLTLAACLALAYWLLRDDWLHGLLAGLTLAMAILPEELPVVLTIFLGLGAWRLARENVLARSIPAIELLGATTVLCVDKTGTLTENRMALRRFWSFEAGHVVDPAAAAPLQEELHALLEYAVLASHRRAFDPMESAITEAGAQLLANTEHLHADWALIEDYPLSRELLAMSRVWRSPDLREYLIAAKGAPEAIVDLCHLDAQTAQSIAAQVKAMAAEGLRVLGVARASFSADILPGNQHDFDFQFLGLVGLEDPVRPEVPQAIAECRAAGIRVVMITGDHPATAATIARQAGLATDGKIMSGTELASMSETELVARLADTHIFCRVEPQQKLRLVQAFRARGDIVAMTGDGVNDAPALKAAHIGVAMGARGTDVAREAAALVLQNDDFASLVIAVRYGRRVFANLRKAIAFVIAAHIPIVGLSILPVLLGWPLLLMPVHILFLQLIIDPACSLVFEAEPLEVDAMLVPPRRPQARLFDAAVVLRGLWQGSGLLLILLGLHALARHLSADDDMARALSFSVLVLANLALIQSNRGWSRGAFRKGGGINRQFVWVALATAMLLLLVLLVPALAGLFVFVLPPVWMLLVGLAVVGVCLLWFELVKWWQASKMRVD